MKKIRLEFFIVPLVIFLTACSVFEFIEENPIGVRIVVRQSVAQYIENGDILNRSQGVIDTVSRAESAIDGNPEAPVDILVEVVKNSINFDNMTVSDRLLINDMITVVGAKLRKEQDQGKLPADTLISIRGLLNTARMTAEMFVE